MGLESGLLSLPATEGRPVRENSARWILLLSSRGSGQGPAPPPLASEVPFGMTARSPSGSRVEHGNEVARILAGVRGPSMVRYAARARGIVASAAGFVCCFRARISVGDTEARGTGSSVWRSGQAFTNCALFILGRSLVRAPVAGWPPPLLARCPAYYRSGPTTARQMYSKRLCDLKLAGSGPGWSQPDPLGVTGGRGGQRDPPGWAEDSRGPHNTCQKRLDRHRKGK